MRSNTNSFSHISSPFLVSNRAKLVGRLPPPVSDIPSGDVDDYKWLIGTHHRDFDDQQIYTTTKVYVIRVQKIPYIVADRVWYTKGRYSVLRFPVKKWIRPQSMSEGHDQILVAVGQMQTLLVT